MSVPSTVSSISMRSIRSPRSPRTCLSREMYPARVYSRRCLRSWRELIASGTAAGRQKASAAGADPDRYDEHPVHLRRCISTALREIIETQYGAEVPSASARRSSRRMSTISAMLLKQALPQDLAKFGLIPEFVGRVPVTVSLDLSGCATPLMRHPKRAEERARTRQYREAV